MPEQVRPPYGNIFEVSTPHIDQLSNRIYAEEQQEKLYRRQQDKMLDDEFARNLSGIRDADIGDLTKAYGDFKLSHIALQKKRGGVSPQDQLDLLRKKASVYDVINKSKQDKQWEDEQAKQIMTDKKGYYADDAHDQLIQRRNTPLSALDKSKDANLLYKYYEPNLTKQLKEAQGVDAEIPIKIGVSKTDPLKDDKEIYKAGNAPDKFANKLLEGVVASNNGRNFAGIYNHKYDDAQLEDLQNRYTIKVNDPKFIAIYGEPKPLPAMNTEVGKAVAIRTMEEFANKEIKPYKMVSELNADRAMNAKQQFSKEQQARGDFYIRRRMKLNEGFKEAFYDYKADADEKQNEGVLNKFIDTSKEAGTDKIDGKKIEGVTIGGVNYKGKFIEVPKAIKSEYAVYNDKDKTFSHPDKFMITEDGKMFIPLFLGDKTVTGGNYLNGDVKGEKIPKSTPVPIQNYKASLAKILLTKKETGSEVVDDDLTDDAPEVKRTTKEVHKVTKSSTRKDPLGIF